jgi:hypothetical protein
MSECCHRAPRRAPFCPWCALKRIEVKINLLEILMVNATDQLTSANSKVDALTFQLTDFVNDVRQALTAINADTLSPTAQAQMDQLLGKTDALATQLANADLEVDPTSSTPASNDAAATVTGNDASVVTDKDA